MEEEEEEKEVAQSEIRKPSRFYSVANRRRRRHVLRRSTGGEEAWLAAPPLKQVMKYAVPTVIALVLLRHQPYPDALFIENPAPVWSFVAASAVYWLLAAEATARGRRRYRGMLRRAAFVVGIQSALSLLSMFLPYPLSLLPLLIPVPFALFVACTPISTLVIRKIRAMAVRINQPHILPV